MHDAVKAYSQTAKIATAPRNREATLLIKAATQLHNVQERWSDDQETALDDALYYNRRLWTVFVSSVARKDNPLPVQIKSNIASLAAFIFHHTLMIQKEPAPEKLNTLININREIAAGLHGRA